MEILDLELGEFTRRIGSVVVSHNATLLTRGLEFGETVLVHAGDGSSVVARVADISFAHADTYYRLELGVSSATALEVGDVVRMLHELPARSHRNLHSA